MLDVYQIGLVSTDLPASLQLYSEAFDFKNAGGQCAWDTTVQGIKPNGRHLIWWLVGAQSFFQLEMFAYTRPETRPKPADWRPSDHGWNRFGITVPGFDACLATLAKLGIDTITPPAVRGGKRCAAFRDPYVGVIIEVIEGDADATGPVVSYATSSVSDIESARACYRDMMSLEILPLDLLHSEEDEALWGLPGAKREGFLAKTKNMLIEVVSYSDPVGRPRPSDYRLSDQGMMNLGIGSRTPAPIAQARDRFAEAGLVPPSRWVNGNSICAYINDPEREFEFCAVSGTNDALFGLAAAPVDFVSRFMKGDD